MLQSTNWVRDLLRVNSWFIHVRLLKMVYAWFINNAMSVSFKDTRHKGMFPFNDNAFLTVMQSTNIHSLFWLYIADPVSLLVAHPFAIYTFFCLSFQLLADTPLLKCPFESRSFVTILTEILPSSVNIWQCLCSSHSDWPRISWE